MLGGILDGREGADDALVVGYVLVRVERDVEVDLVSNTLSLETYTAMRRFHSELTRMRTRLPFRSTSVIASLLERDIVIYNEKLW